jgi:hypothetical protein
MQYYPGQEWLMEDSVKPVRTASVRAGIPTGHFPDISIATWASFLGTMQVLQARQPQSKPQQMWVKFQSIRSQHI